MTTNGPEPLALGCGHFGVRHPVVFGISLQFYSNKILVTVNTTTQFMQTCFNSHWWPTPG